MYKSKLQELCQERYWTLPTYSSVKHGPDHYSFFKATVVVNGSSFSSSVKFTSSKDATNDAAKSAFLHFSSTPYENVKKEGFYNYTEIDWDALFENNVHSSYKSRLQNHAQKSNLTLPFYSHERESAPGQAPRYKAVVNIAGRTFESPQWFCTIKEAEQASAKAALSALVTDDDHQEHQNDCGFYKNLLQGLAQKRDLNLPMYRTARFGHPPNLTYLCSVEVNGEKYSGETERSKKLAEISAAKAAYVALLEKKMSEASISSGVEGGAGDGETGISSNTLKEDKAPSDVLESESNPWDGSYLVGGRVRVYISFPDLAELPKGVTILPVDEGKWVAVGLELSA